MLSSVCKFCYRIPHFLILLTFGAPGWLTALILVAFYYILDFLHVPHDSFISAMAAIGGFSFGCLATILFFDDHRMRREREFSESQRVLEGEMKYFSKKICDLENKKEDDRVLIKCLVLGVNPSDLGINPMDYV